MNHEVSPAVERAAVEAARLALAIGAPSARLVDWMRALLEDDEGRPFELLVRLGIDATKIRERLERATSVIAPSDAELFSSARRHSLRLRGDPDLTTDLVLYAVIVCDDGFRNLLESWGAPAATIEQGLRGANMAAPESATPTNTPRVEFVPMTPVEIHDAARILDVNLNRAREALRVLDDYARFVLNDRLLTEELKSLRHRLASAADELPALALLRSRDTIHDVGTSISAQGEYERSSPDRVAAINFKRLQESLRSLEEYGKLEGKPFAREIEQIRYQAYTLERAFHAGSRYREQLFNARVYVLLTAEQCVCSLDWIISESAAGGASIFQMREKSMEDRELLKHAQNLRLWTRKANALFIVNDRPDIARLVEADGVHLGQTDLPVRDARRILGPDAIIGVSTHTIEQVRAAILDGADYIGVGPTFPSTTKTFETLSGLNFVREAFSATSLPAFALGGINTDNIRDVRRAGGTRVAVSAIVATADEPRSIVQQLVDSLQYPE